MIFLTVDDAVQNQDGRDMIISSHENRIAITGSSIYFLLLVG